MNFILALLQKTTKNRKQAVYRLNCQVLGGIAGYRLDKHVFRPSPLSGKDVYKRQANTLHGLQFVDKNAAVVL